MQTAIWFLVALFWSSVDQIKLSALQVEDNKWQTAEYPVPNPFKLDFNGYYSIKSQQTVDYGSTTKTTIELEELFSLSYGLTYSLYLSREDPNQAFASIGDGLCERSYLVRNALSSDSFTCELDHQRAAFPWRFNFLISENRRNKNRKRKRCNANERFVQGVAAIWLNAIDRQVVSSQIGENSPFPASNAWLMSDRDVDVKLLFDKVDGMGDLKQNIAESRLNSIQIKKSHGSNFVYRNANHIVVKDFQTNVTLQSNPHLRQFFKQLSKCRKETEHHRLFPSLLRAIANSPMRLYGIEYFERHGPNRKSFNQDNRWLFRPNETCIEYFKFDEQTQVFVYTANSDDGDIETFKRRFEVVDEKLDRRSIVNYHEFEMNGRFNKCKQEKDLRPDDHLMIRPIQFVHGPNKRDTYQLVGLGALIMNAAEAHYKQFNLFKKTIDVADDLNQRREVQVDEWQIVDKKTDRVLHFFFLDQTDPKAKGDIGDLVRIDVMDRREVSERKEENLIVSYEITSIFTELDEDGLEFMFKAHPDCPKEAPNLNGSSVDDQWEPVDFGEDLEGEIEPGDVLESRQFPDFFQLLDGQTAYEMVSRLELISATGSKQTIELNERVDLEREWAVLRIAAKEARRETDYYFNYNSELIFQVNENCALIDEPSSWLRLLADKFNYYMIKEATSLESNRLRLYGVGALWRRASESAEVEFAGSETIVDTASGAEVEQFTWSFAEDGDSDMLIYFKFRLNPQLKRLQLDAIEMGRDAANFGRLVLKLTSIEKLQSSSLHLPPICRETLSEASENEQRKKRYYGDISVPSMDDFLGFHDSYAIHFSLTHHRAINESGDDDAVTPFVEYRDKKRNLVRIVVGFGQETRELFIDCARGAIYSFLTASGTCKRIGHLKPLVELGLSLPEHGIGALWKKLAELKDVQLRVSYQHDESANRIQSNRYRIKGRQSNITSNVKVTFISRRKKQVTDEVKDVTSREFDLQRIEFTPLANRGSAHLDNHGKTSIEIEFISLNNPVYWNLPDECAKLDAGTEKFPKLTDLLALNQIHMRSEVAMSRPLVSGERRLYLMDEWLSNKNLRLKTYGRHRNLDLLIYGTSGESFDLSVPYRCSTTLPNLDPYSATDELASNFVQFLADNKTMVENPSHLYYSPLSLWLLAEKSLLEPQRRKVWLFNSLDLAPKIDVKMDSLAREMRFESWRIEGGAWRFDLTFERYSRMDLQGQTRNWIALQRIEIGEATEIDSRGSIEIDVVNYDFNARSNKYSERFRLPEGSDCERKQDVLDKLKAQYDDLLVSLQTDYYFSYEASLELIGDSKEDEESNSVVMSKQVLPTISGIYVRSNSISQFLGAYMDFSAHYNRVRYLNGTSSASKTIYDSFHSLIYKVDRISGSCKVESDAKGKLRLQFASSKGNEFVVLDEFLFRTLFMDTRNLNFKPINRFQENGYDVSIYELSLAKLEVLEDSSSPVSIVRRYQSLQSDKLFETSIGKQKTRLHSTISVRVLIFDQNRIKIKAILNLNLLRVANTDPTNVLRFTNVAECHHNKDLDLNAASFALEYRVDDGLKSEQVNKKQILQNATTGLLMNGKLLATQLNGLPRVELDPSARLIRFHFNLLEAPTAIEYFRRRPASTMLDEMKLKSVAKLLPSPTDCSRWCDQVGCIAMSYCMDRTCNVITKDALRGRSWSLIGLDACYPSHLCSYFYKATERPLTLATFAQFLQLTVNDNSNPSALASFALIIGNKQILPTRFIEFESNFNLAEEKSIHTLAKSYKILKQGYKLDLTQLTESYKTQLDGFKHSIHHAKTYTDCLDICTLADCLLISYCEQEGGLCETLSGIEDYNQAKASIELEQTGCSIAIRDFLTEYRRFDNTYLPSTSELQLDQYSALECAIACESNKDCLSFDSCFEEGTEESDQSNSICLLQKTHLLMDEFDLTILNQTSRKVQNTYNNRELVCEHYSKSILGNFQRIANREFSKTNITIRGLNEERCAIDCQLDDECYAFEHCLNDKSQSIQSCYFIRHDEISGESSTDIPHRFLEDKLLVSRACTVYILKNRSLAFDSYSGTLAHQLQTNVTFCSTIVEHPVTIVAAYIACSFVMGFFIQSAYRILSAAIY